MDKIYIKSVIQKILDKEFSDTARRKIVEYENRLNFCAPCCGDSHKNKWAKRGNLYLNKLMYVCFNCDKKTTFDRLARDFNEPIDPDKKLEIIEHLNSVMDFSDYDNDFTQTNLDDLISMQQLEELFNVKNTTPIYDFKPVQANSGIYKYLIKRGITPELQKNIYSAKYSKGDEGFEHIIVMLNRKDDKVIGLQVRNLKEGRKRFFVIYNWEHLYRWIWGEDVEVDLSKSTLYNKLSLYFNILNINFEEKITIFEGYIDSLFYPNSIGLVGVNTDTKVFFENNNLDIQYFFDNDKAGFDKSEEKIKENGRVFLWNKFFDWIIENKIGDPYDLLNKITKVKDLNKLATLVQNPYKKLELENFFSDDIYDLKWIPKSKKIERNFTKDYIKEFSWNNLEEL